MYYLGPIFIIQPQLERTSPRPPDPYLLTSYLEVPQPLQRVLSAHRRNALQRRPTR